MTEFLTADLHFNHGGTPGIIGLCHRPFADVADMNTGLVARWNAVVGPKDTVRVLGDFGFRGQEPLRPIFDALNGTKHLVIGNHDKKNKEVLKLPWKTQTFLDVLRCDGHRVVLCHYPLESWEYVQKGYLHAHGHCHGSLKRVIAHRFDVGVDCWDFQPVPLQVLVDLAAAQAFAPQDHHA